MDRFDYFKAAQPDSTIVLGLRLLPFSLGHFFHMRRRGVAFVADSTETATVGDLVLGCIVCSMGYAEFLEWEKQPRLANEVFRWAHRISKRGKSPINFNAEYAKFNAYINDGIKEPAYCVERESVAPSGAHWAHSLKVVLTSQLGYTFTQAMDSPLAQSIADFYRYAETQGAIQIMTPEQQELMEAVL